MTGQDSRFSVDTIQAADPEDQTAASSSAIENLTREYADLRDETRLLNSDVTDGHHQVRGWQLEERTAVRAREGALDLLEELSTERGMTWASIARLSGVSVSAVRKWRRGEPVSPHNRYALARLGAFLDLLDEFPVPEPAAWLAMPLVNGHTVTAEDLFLADSIDDLLDFAAGHASLERVLERFNPDWRDSYRSDYVVVMMPDGNRSIAPR